MSHEEERNMLRHDTEEANEACDRRNRLRIRKHIKYTEDDDDDKEDEDKDGKDVDGDQPGPTSQMEGGSESRLCEPMHVTCGNMMGLLYADKLCPDEECIKHNGSWFSPPAFEKLGGKGANKKWRSSILYQNEPLQVLFEKRLLSTKGYQRRSNKTVKPKTILLSGCSSSDEHGAKSEEENVKGNEEAQQRGEERLEAQNGAGVCVEDSEDNMSKEEEDEMEKRGTEDHETAADDPDDNHTNVWKEKEKQLRISPTKKRELQMKLAALLRTESRTSDGPTMVEDVTRNEKEFTRSHEGTDGQRGKSSEGASSPHVRSEDTGSLSHHAVDLTSSPQQLITEIRSHCDDDVTDEEMEAGRDETQRKSEEHLDDATSRATAQRDATAGRAAAADLSCKYEPLLHKNTMTTILPEVKLEMSSPHTPPASDCNQSPSTGPPSSVCLTGPNLVTWEIDHLRREKIKMQLRVLRLQEEYYTLKVKKLKTGAV